MKKMQKVLATVLAGGVVLGMTACGNTNATTSVNKTGENAQTTKGNEKTPETTAKTEGKKRVLKVDGFSGGNAVEKTFKELEAAFEKAHPDVDVQVRLEKELPQVLSKENAMGQYSDLVYYNLGQPSAYTETQLNTKEVMDISDVFAKVKDKMDPAFADTPISNYYGDGKMYLMPIKYTPAGFFYNTELVGEGKKYAVPTTWDEMWALGDKAKADGISLFTYPVKGYFDTTLQGLLDMVGGPQFMKDAFKYKEGTWTSDKGKQVLTTIAKLVDPANGYLFKDTVANANAKDGFKINQQAVIDGKALFMPNGDWIVNEMKETTPATGFHWGLMPLPAFEKGGERVAVSFTEQAWIPKQAKNSADAKAFLEFLYSDEGSKLMISNGFVLPVKDVSKQLTDPYQKEFFAIYNTKGVRPSIGSMAPYDAAALPDLKLKPAMFGPIDEIATGKKTVDQWQESMEKLWTQLREHPAK